MHKETEMDASVRKDKCKVNKDYMEKKLWVGACPKFMDKKSCNNKNTVNGFLTPPGQNE